MNGPPPSVMDPISTGTTLIACEFKDGVVIGADSRTSSGAFIANRVTDKLCPLSDYIFCCRSGSAADTQALADIVKYRLDFHKIEQGRQPTVLEAATLFQSLCYKYRNQISAGIIVAGWDEEKGGQVYSIPSGGMLLRRPATMGGSGSIFLYGFMDKTFKPDLEKNQALDFVKDCVSMAIGRDNSSGGCCRMAVISKGGVERFLYKNNEIPVYFKF